MEKQKSTCCLKELKKMGWSVRLIETLLPKPTLKKNPMYACAAPMKIWNITDVETAMQTPEFQKYLSKRKDRQKASRKSAETKRKNALKDFESIKNSIEIEVIDKEKLRKNTLCAKQDWYCAIGNYDSDPWIADIDTQNRWMVNYIRHKITSYEYDLYLIRGKVGKQDLYTKLKKCILEKIAEAYPYLEDECHSQIDEIGWSYL